MYFSIKFNWLNRDVVMELRKRQYPNKFTHLIKKTKQNKKRQLLVCDAKKDWPCVKSYLNNHSIFIIHFPIIGRRIGLRDLSRLMLVGYGSGWDMSNTGLEIASPYHWPLLEHNWIPLIQVWHLTCQPHLFIKHTVGPDLSLELISFV